MSIAGNIEQKSSRYEATQNKVWTVYRQVTKLGTVEATMWRKAITSATAKWGKGSFTTVSEITNLYTDEWVNGKPEYANREAR